ncbi:rhamnan synthesis F family protein [Megasphaera sp.]|jgi:FMN phosphatase YigB (HAD superfamily)|uniref:rhamnan synthesis F family protein n=1 Tax=Megasphaera sp. TaxID=2023260 RepID=UPI00307740BD
MKNLIKRNNYFNEQSFGALHTFLLRNGRISKLSNLILNILYKYHKYPVTRTLWFHTKSKIKSILRIDIHFSSHRSVKLFNITKNITYTNPLGFKPINNKRCAIFVGYSFDGTIPDYEIYYIKELKKVCDNIIYIMDNPIVSKELDKVKDLVNYAEFRHHGGYDFGSWRRGLIYLREHQLLNDFDSLILANDSCYGPVYPFADLLDKMKTSASDFWGLVDSTDGCYHILSFFYYFKKKVFTDPYFLDFFLKLPKKMKFEDAWVKGEKGFTIYLKQKYTSDVLLPDFSTASSKCYLSGNRNPTLWPYTLLQKGFPLIKVKAMTGGFGIDLHESRADVKNYLYENNKELLKIIIDDLSRRNQNDYTEALPDFDFQSRIFKLAIKDKKIVSFDIFDTLLIRPFSSPTDLYAFLEKKYNLHGFKKERILAEKRARKASKFQEITFEEIYNHILPKYQVMKDIELKWEKKTLQINPHIYCLYKQAIEMGKKVIAVSDMYLDTEFLEEVLISKGYDKIAGVFVSSWYRKTKGSGDLYREILKNLNASSRDLIHIGDNEIADVEIPRKMGITAYHIHKVLDDFLKNPGNAKFAVFNSTHHDLNTSIHLAMIAHRTEKEKNNNLSYWNMLGYRYAGPLALGYLNFLCNQLVENKIDKVLFVARDGWALKKLYDKFYLPRLNIKSGYVYLQRILGIKGLLTWCEEPGYLKILLNVAKKDIPSIIVSKNYEENIKEYWRYHKELLKWAKESHDELVKHVNNEAGENKNIAIVDMTTGAFSSYRFSKEILKNRLKLAIYTGTFKFNDTFIYTTFSPKEFTSDSDLALKFSELLLSSVEPLVVDLKNNKPVYAEEFGVRQKIYPEIYTGMEEYLKDYLNLFGITNVAMNSMYEWMDFATEYFTCSNFIDDDFMKEIYETGLPGIDKNVKSMFEVAKGNLKK